MVAWILFICPGLAPALLCAQSPDLAEREERAMRAAVERVASCVVSIQTVGGLEKVGEVLLGTGPTTGLIVSSDGYIVSSAFNFAQKPASILVGLPDGTRTPARLVATDRSRMLVLLKIDVAESLAVPVGCPSGEVHVGQWSLAVGRTYEARQPNLSVGIISALHRVWEKAIQTDAKISPSNYGGPLIDIHGRVLGVLVPLSPDRTGDVAGVEWYDSGIGFAVPWQQVEMLIPRLREGRDLLPGILGVTLKKGGLYGELPVLTATRPNSPAAKAGLKRGDTIVSIDGTPITQRVELTTQINRRYAGDVLRMTIARGSERFEREVELVGKLEPYTRPFLGILPRRDARSANDDALPSDGGPVEVRFVFAGSPADRAGVSAGDRIVRVEDQAVEGRRQLGEQLAALAVDQQIRLEIERQGETLRMTARLSTDSDRLPTALPAARTENPSLPEDRPAVGRVPFRLPEFKNESVLVVPENYDPRADYGLVVWLHGMAAYKPDEVVARWQAECAKRDFLVFAPHAAEGARWSEADVEFIQRAIDRIQTRYRVDGRRVAIYGYEAGGPLAYHLAFEDRERIRGLAVVNAPPPGGAVPENDPEFPLGLFIASSPKLNQKRFLERLTEARFVPVVHQAEPDQDLSGAGLHDFVVWFDSLDRL